MLAVINFNLKLQMKSSVCFFYILTAEVFAVFLY